MLPSLRGLRLGELILQGMEEHVRERKGGLGHLLEKGRGEAWRGWGEREGQVRIAAHCQRGLVQYYQRCGYEVVGGEFAEVSLALCRRCYAESLRRAPSSRLCTLVSTRRACRMSRSSSGSR